MQTYHEVKFLHQTKLKKGTLAYVQPELKKIVKSIQEYFRTGEPMEIELMAGFSVLHPKDQFNRKMGRELAEADVQKRLFKMSFRHFNLAGGEDRPNSNITFSLTKKRLHFYIEAKLYNDSRKIRITSFFIEEIK